MGSRWLGFAAIAFASVAAVGLTACGSSNNGSSDQDQIKAAINAAAVSGDPSACTKYQTQRFVEQTNGGTKGQAAIKQCEQDAQSGKADKVEVTDISVNGDNATALVHWTGNFFDGQTLKVSLVKQNGVWKLDQFNGFENFNRDAFLAAFPASLAKQPGTTPQAVDCVRTQLQQVSDQEIVSSFTTGNSALDQKVGSACGKYFKGGNG
jgi:hypothetical protein